MLIGVCASVHGISWQLTDSMNQTRIQVSFFFSSWMHYVELFPGKFSLSTHTAMTQGWSALNSYENIYDTANISFCSIYVNGSLFQ